MDVYSLSNDRFYCGKKLCDHNKPYVLFVLYSRSAGMQDDASLKSHQNVKPQYIFLK